MDILLPWIIVLLVYLGKLGLIILVTEFINKRE